MSTNPEITRYFSETVIPTLEKRHPEVARHMAIQVRGSYGLGLADEHSDLDAIVWLDDPLWKREGGQVQLTLLHDIPRLTPRELAAEHGHAEVNVWPLSWLGARRKFLESTSEAPWEEVSFEELFELQHNLVVRDPERLFDRLRKATRPENYPAALWRKRLIVQAKQLDDDLIEYRQVVRRDRRIEEPLMAGRVLEGLLRLGFYISKQYFPWRTHLNWAFRQLPPPACEVASYLDAMVVGDSPAERFKAAQGARDIYHDAILKQGLLSREVLDALNWAERLEAWSNKDWHDWITRCQASAQAAGDDPEDFWIWSLWGWK